jgi:futalosine hydrolase
MHILITAATEGEWMPSSMQLKQLYPNVDKRIKIQFCTTGVGILSTSVCLTQLILRQKPDLIIQMGIAGSFNKQIPLGKVLAVKEEILGDMGVEEGGEWKDIFDLKLEKSSNLPFRKGKLLNPWLIKFNLLKLPMVRSITVNQISTQKKRIAILQEKYKPILEGMEGPALHYTCQAMNIPFIQIRSVSNYIGERNKNNWKIKEAIHQLNQTILVYIDALYKMN